LLSVGAFTWPIEAQAEPQCEKHRSTDLKLALEKLSDKDVLKFINLNGDALKNLSFRSVWLKRNLSKIDENTVALGNRLLSEQKILPILIKQRHICVNVATRVYYSRGIRPLGKSYLF
jgi:hypothetical protein